MPLFELEEGSSRKFYRIELVDNRVELHWGRIGTAGTRKVLEFASPAAAKTEYQAQVFHRAERGYRRVIDESVPHEPTRATKVDATGPLTASPRFLFTHARRRRFVWVEVRGDEVITATGAIGQEAAAEPTVHKLASAAAAVRRRDEMTAGWLADGYALDSFAAAAPSPKKRRARSRPSLCVNAELEAVVAESPDDDDAWSVLEDWQLEQGDARAETIELERGRARADAAQARGKIMSLLLGPRASALQKAMTPRWRGGYLRSCRLDLPARRPGDVFAALAAAPAARLLSRLHITAADFAPLSHLAGAVFCQSLRALELGSPFSAPAALDARLLAPLSRLAELELGPVASIEPDPCLGQISSITITSSGLIDLAALFRLPLPRLTTLRLALREHGRHDMDAGQLSTGFAAALSANAAALVELRVSVRHVEDARSTLDALARHDLARRLRRLAIDGCGRTSAVAGAEAAARWNGAFARVDEIELPDAVIADAGLTPL